MKDCLIRIVFDPRSSIVGDYESDFFFSRQHVRRDLLRGDLHDSGERSRRGPRDRGLRIADCGFCAVVARGHFSGSAHFLRFDACVRVWLRANRAIGAQSAIRNPQSTSSAAMPQEAVVLRREGNEALYNMDYATARAKFEEIKKRIPHHPAGDLYVATVIWLEHLNKSRRLQTSLYKNESSFYAGAEKAKEESEGDAVDSTVDRAIRDRMAQAKTKALSLVARNKNDADAQYFLGAYYGVMAGYEASTARKFYSAMRNGSRSVDAHEKTLKLDPNYYDAYLSV